MFGSSDLIKHKIAQHSSTELQESAAWLGFKQKLHFITVNWYCTYYQLKGCWKKCSNFCILSFFSCCILELQLYPAGKCLSNGPVCLKCWIYGVVSFFSIIALPSLVETKRCCLVTASFGDSKESRFWEGNNCYLPANQNQEHFFAWFWWPFSAAK